MLQDFNVAELRTAPHARCRETAEIIGRAVGTEPQVDESLHIARAFRIQAVSGVEVWVAHSNNIPDALNQAGVKGWRCGMASAWRVDFDDAGNVVAATYFDPSA